MKKAPAVGLGQGGADSNKEKVAPPPTPPARDSQPDRPRRSTRRAVYGACSTKRRTGAEVAEIRAAILDILRADHPQTVRQVFYQLVVRGAVEKTEREYQKTVIRLLRDMRLSGEIDFDWIIDSSRITHETQTFDNLQDAVEQTAKYYRRSAMRESSSYRNLV